MKPLFALLLSTMLGLIAISHWTIYIAIRQFWAIANPYGLIALQITLVVFALSFIVTTLLTNLAYRPLTRWLYVISAIWLGTVYWAFFASILGLLLVQVNPFISFAIPLPLAGQLLLIGAVLISIYGVIKSFFPRLTRYTVQLPNLPASWENKTLVLIADVHLGNVRGQTFAHKIAHLINNQRPAAVLIAGDFYDGPPIPFAEFTEPFRNLHAPKGVYFANGNHDEYRENSQYTKALEAVGVRVLRDEVVDIDGLQIAGVNYSSTLNKTETARILKMMALHPERPSILIKHIPSHLMAVAEAGVHLQVSGHTHAGQIWPGKWLTNQVYRGFGYGHNQHDTLQVITTSGAGTWGPPQRIGTDAEIVIITLQNKSTP